MLTIIEILFLIAGLSLLISGKIPNKLFQIMYGKGDYQLSPPRARLFGLLLASPLILALVFGESFRGIGFFYLLGLGLISIGIARTIRQSPQQESEQILPLKPKETAAEQAQKYGIEVVKCPSCNTINSLSFAKCIKCSTSLAKEKPIRNPYL